MWLFTKYLHVYNRYCKYIVKWGADIKGLATIKKYNSKGKLN